MRILLTTILSCTLLTGFSQILKGVIYDSASQAPVAFAHVTLNDRKTGTTSDIDGTFTLSLPISYKGNIIISHISYKTKTLTVDELLSTRKVHLQLMLNQLKEVTVLAGENPAWKIIRKAVANSNTNDPKNLKSYNYTSYSKLIATAAGKGLNIDSLVTARAKDEKKLSETDSSRIATELFLKQSHIFFSESVTEKFFQQPGKHAEKLIAHNASGFKSPLFAALPNNYQPIGFYGNFISLLDKDYLNPISINSERKYEFWLTDTLYTDIDTVYVIGFEPIAKTNFNALKGKVSVSTKGFAIKNVIAENVDPTAKINFRIQQNYDWINDYWFPVQLNTDLRFSEFKFGDRAMLIQVRSYLKDILINNKFPSNTFGGATVEFSESNYEKSIDQYRVHPLDSLDTRTYFLYDSIREKIPAFAVLDKLTEGIITSALPIGKIDLDLTRFLKINRYEKIRFGIGLQTNSSFSKWLQLGGYAGYGIKDKAWKYNGFFQIMIAPKREFYVRAGYENTIREAGVQLFFENTPRISSQAFRDWLGVNFDHTQGAYVKTGWRLFSNWSAHLSARYFTLKPLYNYALMLQEQTLSNFKFNEVSSELTYAGNQERLSLNGRQALLNFQQPLLSIKITKSITDVFNSNNINYTRYDLLFSNEWKHRRLGTTKLSLLAGQVDGVTPFNNLYYGRGTYSSGYQTENYFQTMGVNEFISDQYINIFLLQRFGSIFWNKRYSKPELFLSQGIGYGELRNSKQHLNVVLNSFENGFFESGIGLDNIIRFNYLDIAYLGIGGGLFYRYGSYQFNDTSENFAATLNISFTF